jgi:hypothetical protein
MRIFLSPQSGVRPIELLTAVHILLTGNTASVEAAGLGGNDFPQALETNLNQTKEDK